MLFLCFKSQVAFPLVRLQIHICEGKLDFRVTGGTIWREKYGREGRQIKCMGAYIASLFLMAFLREKWFFLLFL